MVMKTDGRYKNGAGFIWFYRDNYRRWGRVLILNLLPALYIKPEMGMGFTVMDFHGYNYVISEAGKGTTVIMFKTFKSIK